MSARRRLERASEDRRPVVTDDFIYDEPTGSVSNKETDSAGSDTPEEAIRKLKGSSAADAIHSSLSGMEDRYGSSGSRPDDTVSDDAVSSEDSTGTRKTKERKSHPVIRGFILILVTVSLILAAAAYIFNRIYGNDAPAVLGMPENAISTAVTPVQSFFSGLTETVFGYFRTLKLRSNIETAYNELVAENGTSHIKYIETETHNNFMASDLQASNLFVPDRGKRIKVIQCLDGQLITQSLVATPKVENGAIVSDVDNDVLKLVVVNRYKPTRPAVAFIKGFGLKRGALASSVAHDSHNLVAVGVTDKDILHAVNLLIEHKGGVTAYCNTEMVTVPLPVAGLMSNEDGYQVAQAYQNADALAKRMGSKLFAPFMTLAFMALLVIPELKLSDKGLFDVNKFDFTSIYDLYSKSLTC